MHLLSMAAVVAALSAGGPALSTLPAFAPLLPTGTAAPVPAEPLALIPLLPAAAAPLLNHGPSTSGGGSAVLSGETLRKGRFSFELRSELTGFDEASVEEAEAQAIAHGEFDSLESALVTTLSVAYGLSDAWELGAEVGYYSGSDFIDAEEDGLGGAESAFADPKGLTDLWLRARRRVLRGSSGEVALLGGVKLPTGTDDEQLSNGEELEPSSQPGTGSVDWQLGLGYSRSLTPRTTLDASGLYSLRTEHDGFEVGDRADMGLALAYRLTEDAAAQHSWSVFGELTGVWLGKDEEDGEANDDSGGTTIYLSAGARDRISDLFAVSLAPAVAVLQDVNGEQVEADWKVALTLSATP